MQCRTITEKDVAEVFERVMSDKKLFPKQVDPEAFKKALTLLINRLNHDVSYNANITIVAEDSEDSDQYGRALVAMVEHFFPECCLSATKEELNSMAYKKEGYKERRIVLVKGLSDIQPELLYEILEDAEKDGWTPSFIFCTGSRDLEKLKSFERQDYRLFHYLCGLKLQVSEIDVSMILEQTLSRLKAKGYGITDGFRCRLDNYIKAVYPEARLAKTAFVEDLISRIFQQHFQTISEGRQLDESDVPYSLKAKQLLAEVTTPDQTALTSAHQKTSDAPAKKPDVPQKKKELKFPNLSVQETHFTDLSGSSNVLLLSMSTLPPNPRGSKYCFLEKIQNDIACRLFSGVSQLEPGTKLFLSELAVQNLRPDKIIIFTTPETWKLNENLGKSAVDVYSENIKSFISGMDQTDKEMRQLLHTKIEKKENSSPVFPDIQIKDLYETAKKSSLRKGESGGERKSQSLDELRQYLDIQIIPLEEQPLQEVMHTLNVLAEKRHVNLFIDLQGGSRSFMFTMFAATTLLRDKNVTIKDMFAIQFDRDNIIHPIEILNSEYAILDLVTGIRAFTRYGKVDELNRFLQSRNLEQTSHEADLLAIMEDIDGCMQINNPEGFAHELNMLSNDELLSADTYDDEQFKLIVEDLKDTYDPLIRPEHDVLDQIKWFGEKAFTTSALTFIEAKMPAFVQDPGNGPIIKTVINSNIPDYDIVRCCGGKNYYSRETNVFFGFSKLVEKAENDFIRDLCGIWADQLLNKLRNSGVTISLRCGSLFDKVNKILNNVPLKDALLKIEADLGMVVWNNLKMKEFCKLATGSSDISVWNTFCNRNSFSTFTDPDIRMRDFLSQQRIMNHGLIMSFFNPGYEIKGRLEALIKYLCKNDYPFIQPVSDSDNQIRAARETVLKELVIKALYNLLYDNSDDTRKKIPEYVEKLLRPLIGNRSNLLNNVSLAYDSSSNILIFTDNGYDKDRYGYELWLEIMAPDTASKASLENVVSEYVVSTGKTEEWKKYLDRLSNELICTDNPGIEQLIEFAAVYTRCRIGKENLKNNLCTRIQDSRCSCRNLELYAKLPDSVPNSSVYRSILNGYFRSVDDQLLTSIAGICNPAYLALPNREGTSIFEIIESDGVINPDSRLLDVCLNLYQALKKERNASNHAEEIGSNHMDYRHTRMAIRVFVDLCKSLKTNTLNPQG